VRWVGIEPTQVDVPTRIRTAPVVDGRRLCAEAAGAGRPLRRRGPRRRLGAPGLPLIPIRLRPRTTGGIGCPRAELMSEVGRAGGCLRFSPFRRLDRQSTDGRSSIAHRRPAMRGGAFMVSSKSQPGVPLERGSRDGRLRDVRRRARRLLISEVITTSGSVSREALRRASWALTLVERRPIAPSARCVHPHWRANEIRRHLLAQNDLSTSRCGPGGLRDRGRRGAAGPGRHQSCLFMLTIIFGWWGSDDSASYILARAEEVVEKKGHVLMK
jgi:hypothetical protein